MTPTKGTGRPTKGYRNAAGKRVPSVTTITGYCKGGGLIQWAYNRGLDGLGLYDSRDEAALVGSVVHDWIEQDIHHPDSVRVFPDDFAGDRDLVERGYAAYKKWRAGATLQILETEVPLVSEEYQYGGTLDAVALVGGDRVLFDWKTSNGTHPDYIAQVAAYRHLIWERADAGLDSGKWLQEGVLLRVGKDYGDFHVHSWPSNVLDLGWELFLAMKTRYELEKVLKSVAS